LDRAKKGWGGWRNEFPSRVKSKIPEKRGWASQAARKGASNAGGGAKRMRGGERGKEFGLGGG